jgi:flagellar biosynthesis protein FliP
MAVAKAFAITSLPFVVIEAATGTISMATGYLSIPPVIGIGVGVDFVILIAGLAVAVLRLRGEALTSD